MWSCDKERDRQRSRELRLWAANADLPITLVSPLGLFPPHPLTATHAACTMSSAMEVVNNIASVDEALDAEALKRLADGVLTIPPS